MRVRLLNLPVAAAVGARGGPRARRGLATIYAMVSAVALICMMSFVVDLSRVQLAKTELRSAVDAAAKAGAGKLNPGSNTNTDFTNAKNTAATIFGDNKIDGQ